MSRIGDASFAESHTSIAENSLSYFDASKTMTFAV